ncbi:hypothetical protein GCM10027432_05110 [Lysobacter fragariae]
MHVRLAAESPKASKRSHLNPGFKVVSYASHTAEDFLLMSPVLRWSTDSGDAVQTAAPENTAMTNRSDVIPSGILTDSVRARGLER